MQLRIEMAIARAKEEGRVVMKKEIAARLWPDSAPAAQMVNMSSLCQGRTARIAPEWVPIICGMTSCSADYLFGMSND